MGDDGFGIAQIVGNLDDLQRVQEANAASLPPFSSSDTTVPPDPICAHRQSVLRVAARPGIDHAGQPRMAFQRLRHMQRVARLRPHRRSSVSMPFSIIQAVNGLIAPPVCFI